MGDFASFGAFAISLVAFFTSITAVMIQYGKRHEHPVVAPLEAEITTLRMGMIEVVDKLEHFTRRERTRRAREAAAPEDVHDLVVPPPINPKEQLRAVARAKGILR